MCHHPLRPTAAALTFVAAVCCCCPCCIAQTPSPSLPTRSQFIGFLWSEQFGLNDSQTLTESQFLQTLADLRIGSYHNASCGTSRAGNETGAGERTTGAFDSVKTCLSGDSLASAFGLNLTIGLSRENFSELAVALLQQQLSGKCIAPSLAAEDRLNITSAAKDTKWAYIYGTVSVAIISLLSVAGCILVSCYRLACFQHLMLFMVELAVGSLVGESLMHLLPTVVENGHEETGGMPPSFLKLVATAAAMCVMHAVDTGSSVGGLEGHSHDAGPPQVQLEESMGGSNGGGGQAYSVSTTADEAAAEVGDGAIAKPDGSSDPLSFVHPRVRIAQLARSPKLCLRNPVRLCLFIMLGDALHNFADGVSIGAAFALSNGDGLRLSLTIGLHELAHEVADFAVLLSCGFSVKAAVVINFVCTATSFIGMYVAIPLSEMSSEVLVWILAVTAAMFLYIALVTMTNLVRRSYRPKSTAAFIVGNLGLITGFASVIAISMYEFYG